MFGRKSANSLRAAELALRQGQLDRAFALATAPQFAEDPRALRLLADLGEPLMRRAQEHVINERFVEALADLDRVARCGVLHDKVEDWRRDVRRAMSDRQQQRRAQVQAVETAERHLAEGELTLAREALDGLANATAADRLARQADAQAARAKEMLADARAALGRSDLVAAAQRWMAARRHHPAAEGLHDVEIEITRFGLRRAEECLVAGRLDQFAAALAELDEIGRDRPERRDLDALLTMAQQAAALYQSGDRTEAATTLGRMARIAPHLAWVDAVREQLRQLDAAHAALCEGPLGLLMDRAVVRPAEPRAARRLDETQAAPPGRAAAAEPPADALPPRLMLRVDGVGSFLILRNDRIVIGRRGPGASADLGLVSDLPEHAAEIIRSHDEYLLFAQVQATVAEQPMRQALLNDGDRIRLGARVRLKFLKPCARSATAVLELGPGLRAMEDVRRVVLFGGPLLLGGGPECHVPMKGSGLVLTERGGRLYARDLGAVGEMTLLPLGQSIELAGLRMSVQPWREPATAAVHDG